MNKIIVVSLIIIAIWIVILCNPNVPAKIKSTITALVVASPIPPFP